MMSRRGRKGGCSILNYLHHQPYREEFPRSISLMGDTMDKAESLCCRELSGHFGCVNAIEFSNHGGEWLISGGDDRRVLMWNVEEGISGNPKLVSMNGQHNSNIFCLAFDPSNSKIFSGGNDEQVIVHDVQTKETTDVFSHSEAVYGLSADPLNASVFASACDDGRILVYDIRAPPSEDPFILANYPSAPMHAVVHNPVEPRLLATANAKEGVCLWDIRKPRNALLRYGGNMFQQSCMSVRFNQLGDQLVALRRKLPPVLYDLNSSAAVYQFDHTGYYNSCTMKSCCFAGHRDQYIISGSDDFNLYMWKIPDRAKEVPWIGQAHMVLKGHRSIVNQVRFNPSNHLIASSGVEKIIKMWSPFRLPKREKGVLVSDEESQEGADRLVYTHEEYINLVIDSGQVMTHDYTHQSTDEDPRMMAFFDSLVQRELEGCTSDDSNMSALNEEYERFVNYVATRTESDTDTDSTRTDNATRSNPDSNSDGEESDLSPFTIAFASAMASRARTVDYEALDDLQPSLDIDMDDERNCLPGQRNVANRRSISDLITMKRKEYLLGIKRKELEAKKKKQRRRSKVKQILKRQNVDSSSSSSSESDLETPSTSRGKKRRRYDDTSDDSQSSDDENARFEQQLKSAQNSAHLKRLKNMRARIQNSDNDSEKDEKDSKSASKSISGKSSSSKSSSQKSSSHKSSANEPEASTSSATSNGASCLNSGASGGSKSSWLENGESQGETEKETGPYLHELTRSSIHCHSSHSHSSHGSKHNSGGKLDFSSGLKGASSRSFSKSAPDCNDVCDSDRTAGKKIPDGDDALRNNSEHTTNSNNNDDSVTSKEKLISKGKEPISSFKNFKRGGRRQYRAASQHESSDEGS